MSTFESSTTQSRAAERAELRWFLTRYGDAVEYDVATRTTYRFSMFERGEESWETLLNLCRGFCRVSTTQLFSALHTDVELYELHEDDPEGPPVLPDMVEETPEVSSLKTMVELLQVSNHLLSKRPGKAKVDRMPRPRTAREEAKVRRQRKSFRDLEASFKFVSNEDYERGLREHGEQVVTLNGTHVHRGNGNAGHRAVDAGVSPEARGGPEDD